MRILAGHRNKVSLTPQQGRNPHRRCNLQTVWPTIPSSYMILF
jgi:hypothetical protein